MGALGPGRHFTYRDKDSGKFHIATLREQRRKELRTNGVNIHSLAGK